jgi:hypothetical protein
MRIEVTGQSLNVFGLTCDSLPPARTPNKKCSENPPALKKRRAKSTLTQQLARLRRTCFLSPFTPTQREASVSSAFTFLLNSLNASNQALRVSPVYRASMRLGVCERSRLIPVTLLHSFLSGVTRAARRHAPLFIINE